MSGRSGRSARATRWARAVVGVAALAAAALVLGACGAKTGLRVWDREFDGGMDAPGEDALVCMPGRFDLLRFENELLFVLDRSGSMSDNLEGQSMPPRRWDVLRDALAATLPAIESDVRLGAFAFPRRFDGNTTRSCSITRQIDVAPATRNARAVLALLEGTDPWGSTPTSDAVGFAGDFLAARVSRTRAVTMVLATDGGPNCNSALDPATCECTSVDTMGRPNCFGRPTSCLDDARAAETLRGLAARGVPTYVIGLDSTARVVERNALERMARAGGRANMRAGEPAYYSARQPEALRAAFAQIQERVARCTLATPSRPDDPDAISIELAGAQIPRDVSRTNGWDWTSMDFGQITFFGASCERLRASTAVPQAIVACRPDAGG